MISRDFAGFSPYIFKAYYDYIVDHEDTPHLLINPGCPGVVLPARFKLNKELILSISPAAVHNFNVGRAGLSFATRFSGESHDVFLPYNCIQEIIATESKISVPIRVFFAQDLEEQEAQGVENLDGPGFEIMDDNRQDKGTDAVGEDGGTSKNADEPHTVEESNIRKDDDKGGEPDFTILT